MDTEASRHPIIDNATARFLESGVAICVATHGRELAPHLSRAWAARLAPNRRSIELFLPAAQGASCLQDLVDDPRIAAVFSHPSEYRSYQIKGELLDSGSPRPEDEAHVEAYFERLIKELGAVGIAPEQGRRILERRLVRLNIAIKQFFNQTPGIGAGDEIVGDFRADPP